MEANSVGTAPVSTLMDVAGAVLDPLANFRKFSRSANKKEQQQNSILSYFFSAGTVTSHTF